MWKTGLVVAYEYPDFHQNIEFSKYYLIQHHDFPHLFITNISPDPSPFMMANLYTDFFLE